ncbi:MAG: 4-hydroxythreonine-4-phosphate dehydrogenase PdxA [Spirochaetota bacterium]
MSKPVIKIGITIGDPAGIGPEVTLNAINELSGLDIVPVVIARAEVLQKHYSALLKEYKTIRPDEISSLKIPAGSKYLLNIYSNNPVPSPGKGSAGTGLESKTYIDEAVGLWKKGVIDAVVTGPVSKALIEKTGFHFSGHTEYIADLINEENPYMMMYSADYRVLLVTTHIPVKDIFKSITAEKIYNTIKAGYKAIKLLDGKSNVRIAVAGLDPHCGDEGAIGTFDADITRMVVEKAAKEGINIEGPFAADTLFTPQKWKTYNLAIAHYHDQGLIPFKALAFESGINVTLGLSIVRTSPDHGTAFDIAGQNKANYKSMLEAIKLAYKLAMNKQK